MSPRKETPSEYVARVLKEKDISVYEAVSRARRLGHIISPGYLSNVAYGSATNPTIKIIRAIAAAIGEPESAVATVFGLNIHPSSLPSLSPVSATAAAAERSVAPKQPKKRKRKRRPKSFLEPELPPKPPIGFVHPKK